MDMGQQVTKQDLDEFARFAMEKMSFLQTEYGFSPQTAGSQGLLAKAIYTHVDLAIEITLDWKDRAVDCMVVRMENGEFPVGYYVSPDGKTIRKHVAGVIREFRCDVDQTVLAHLRKTAHLSYWKRTLDVLKSMVEDYRKILISCMACILQNKEKLF